MFTDREAYRSKLRNISSGLKCSVVLLSIVMCIYFEKIPLCCIVMTIMTGLCLYSGIKLKKLILLFSIPFGFIFVSTVALSIDKGIDREAFFAALSVETYYIGVSRTGLFHAAITALKAMACVSCMYFLSLTTPMTDLLILFKKMHLPKFFVEITALVYRYIFILLDAARNIYIAQEARLGYFSLKNAYRSTGVLAAGVFIKALKQADRSYTALEARGYIGEIPMLKKLQRITVKQAAFTILYIIVLYIAGIWF